jgi:hypothetical protein
MNAQQHFRQIKQLFFPRWDRKKLWRIRTSSRRTADGCCDSKRRVIKITRRSANPDERDLVLIHEICHALFSGHERAWQGRMKKAARRADELGRHQLAQLLRKEIVGCQQSPSRSVQKEQFYEDIQDAVIENPNLTLAAIKMFMADRYALLVSEVYTAFPRTKAVYREAKRTAALVWGPDSIEIE